MTGQAPRDDDDSTIKAVLKRTRTIVVVGASPKPVRPSNQVMRFLIERGYDVVAVNPGHAGGSIRDRPCYASLAEVPHALDMVDVFRSPDAVPAVVDDVLSLGQRPSTLWLQLGVVHPEAERRAREAGLTVVADRCPKIEVARLGL